MDMAILGRRDGRFQRRLVKLATRLAVRRGELSQEDADAIVAASVEKDWMSFLEWLLENAPKIMEMLLMLIALF